jgi:hypothetical protein
MGDKLYFHLQAQAPAMNLPGFTLPLATAPLSFPFISEAQATVNNAVQWAAGLPAAGMQVIPSLPPFLSFHAIPGPSIEIPSVSE